MMDTTPLISDHPSDPRSQRLVVQTLKRAIPISRRCFCNNPSRHIHPQGANFKHTCLLWVSPAPFRNEWYNSDPATRSFLVYVTQDDGRVLSQRLLRTFWAEDEERGVRHIGRVYMDQREFVDVFGEAVEEFKRSDIHGKVPRGGEIDNDAGLVGRLGRSVNMDIEAGQRLDDTLEYEEGSKLRTQLYHSIYQRLLTWKPSEEELKLRTRTWEGMADVFMVTYQTAFKDDLRSPHPKERTCCALCVIA